MQNKYSRSELREQLTSIKLENVIKLLFYVFIYFYFRLRWVFTAARRLPLVVVSGGYSSLRWLLLLQSTGSRRVGFSSCGTWAQ